MMNERTLVKVYAGENCVGFRTISRKRKSKQRFLVTRSELMRLEHEQRIITQDIYSFAVLRRDAAAGTLSIDFSWLNGGCVDGTLTGWEETVTLPYEALTAFVEASAQEDGPKEWRQLSLRMNSRPKLVFCDHEGLRRCVENKMVRRKLARVLRDSFYYPNVERIDFYHDFAPYSFLFRETRNGRTGIVGGLIFHDHQNDLKKASYSIHT